MNERRLYFLYLGAMLILGACVAPPPIEELWGDINAPGVVNETLLDNGSVLVEFDEEVVLDESSLRANGGASPLVVESRGKTLHIDTSPGTKPGKSYSLALSASDAAGNTVSLVMPFFGPNPELAPVLINEVGTMSSTNIRDFIELIVLADGNLAGLTVLLGLAGNADGAYTFSDIDVKRGDLILVHCKPEGLPEEVNESDDWSLSGGKNAVAGVLDVWMPGVSGLPDASGVVSLVKNEGGNLMDFVFYSDKVSEEGKDYRSFGTKKLLDRVEAGAKQGAWLGAGEVLVVEDAAQTGSLTSTRTLCRGTDLLDTNRANDWHIVPSSKASPGKANSDLVYVKP